MELAMGAAGSAGNGLATAPPGVRRLAGSGATRASTGVSVVINGRFLGQAVSGVQRYGREMLRALDALLTEDSLPRFASIEVLVPPDCPARDQGAALRSIRLVRTGRLTGHAWEQLELSWQARRSVLVNLTNSAPLLHGRQIVAIHDASIAAFPDNFTRAYRIWYRLLYAGLRRGPARFITVSKFSAAEIARLFGITPDRIDVVPNAAEHLGQVRTDAAILQRLGLPPQGYVVAVGGRSRRKNLEAAEQALALLGPAGVPLVLVGRSISRVFAAAPAGAGAAIIELGHLADSEMKALYEHALCLVFPSFYEGFGLPPLEAMSCGCPVICSDAASLPEVCGDAALYFDPASPAALAQRIGSLQASSELRRALIERGRARALRFGWRRSAEALLCVIEATARGTSRMPAVAAPQAGASGH
jgi:glycosyltransferase involved in cell wall biosynthesis